VSGLPGSDFHRRDAETQRRQVRVKALAKINLDLRVLGVRGDGYHELRTVFQTVSLADTIDIGYVAGRETAVCATADVEIPGQNLAGRAAELALEAMKKRGRVEIRIEKRIPMGAGLGGGSSDAAAVLLAMPALVGRRLELGTLMDMAGCLGSDVPFFLLGGRALGMGRGTELYPLPEPAARWGVLATPEVHVDTAGAYQALDRARALTSEAGQNIISSFQCCVWQDESARAQNDFEAVVFAEHPRLKSLRARLQRLGAEPARLSGSGAALYGLFGSRERAERARQSLGKEKAEVIRLVTRARYRQMWWRQLGTQRTWPPQR
jgi:4-diphosphocytidyl-2-C-methyl-D-erythritol kinase